MFQEIFPRGQFGAPSTPIPPAKPAAFRPFSQKANETASLHGVPALYVAEIDKELHGSFQRALESAKTELMTTFRAEVQQVQGLAEQMSLAHQQGSAAVNSCRGELAALRVELQSAESKTEQLRTEVTVSLGGIVQQMTQFGELTTSLGQTVAKNACAQDAKYDTIMQQLASISTSLRKREHDSEEHTGCTPSAKIR